MKNSRGEKAICCNPERGAVFGGGHDLSISHNANKNQRSFSNIGYTYQLPLEYTTGDLQTKALLAGSFSFTPTEIETFSQINENE